MITKTNETAVTIAIAMGDNAGSDVLQLGATTKHSNNDDDDEKKSLGTAYHRQAYDDEDERDGG